MHLRLHVLSPLESTPKCLIRDEKAYCALRNLYEVPALPPYITYLDLTLNYISEIHENSFNGLETLQILKIQQQQRRLTLRNNSFIGLSNLTTLDLAYNMNLQVDPGAFNGLINLQILNLTECRLSESILSGEYLRPLVSLEQLSLPGNNVHELHPASFFINMSKLHTVDVSHNWIKSFCEEDLFHFQGKHFTHLKLHDIKMLHMTPYWSGWDKCGNPFKDMSMTMLDLSQNGFSVDVAVRFFKAIKGTKIHKLILHSSGSMGKGVWYKNMKDPDRDTFKDLAESGVKALDLSKASIFTLKNSVFSHMPDLEDLSLANNVINQIESDAFNGLDKLQKLNLNHNLLDKIESRMFNNLPSLKTLDLSNNNIRLLMSQSFQGLPNLANLFLSENSLQSLHTLASLPSLQGLYVDNNKITSLYGLPSQVRNITTIDLRYNRLSNAESFYTILVEFPNVKNIFLGGNVFSSCFLNSRYSVSPLNNVHFLDLQMTGLQKFWSQGQCLTMFDHLPQLQTLILKNNFIQSLPKNIFNGLTSLGYLDLSMNSLTYIPNGIFPESLKTLNLAFNRLGSVDPQAFSNLTTLELSGNFFLCDCSLRDFQRWLTQTNVTLLTSTENLRRRRTDRLLHSERMCTRSLRSHDFQLERERDSQVHSRPVSRRCLSMTDRIRFILPLLKLCICLLVAESTPKCLIRDEKAYCALGNLTEVPALPPYITYLDLTLNYISEIHENSFNGLETLQILKIQQQQRRLTLRNNSFIGLSNLTTLDLAYNMNLQVDPGAFNGLINLQILNLTECRLSDSVLSGEYLRPLVSLEQLSLPGNNIHKLHPASFFINMSKLHTVDVSHNWINSFCEEDLFHFQGKNFTLLKLHDIKMLHMTPYWSGWDKCGNPFKDMSMTVLDLSQNGFSVDVAVRFFKAIRGTKIHTLILNFSKNNTKDPDHDTFKDLAESGIRTLDLSNGSIFVLKTSVFSYMPDLESLSLIKNAIDQIETDAFNGLDNLRTLNLSYNILDKIYSETFNNLQSLKTLDLSNNGIKLLMSRSFQRLPNLTDLSLSENSLQSLHTLASLPSLKGLYVDNNKITSLYGLPSQVRNISLISLKYNSLSNAESFYTILVEFPNVEEIYLGGNVFSWCSLNGDYPVSPVNNVHFLDLHITGLEKFWLQGQCLNMFAHLHQLQTLHLNINYIKSLPENIFNGLTSLDYLDLSVNFLTYIPNGIFPKSLKKLNLAFNRLGSVDTRAFSTLTLISLLENNFLCDCGLEDLQTWLNETDVQMDSPAEELMCEFPEAQRGRPLLQAKLLCKDEEVENYIEELRLILFICCTIIIILTTTGAIIFIRMRGYCFKLYRKVIAGVGKESPNIHVNDDFVYDVYLCFSSKDMKWVTKALLEKLDTQFSDRNHLRCCFEARDFIPGEDHLSNIHNAICKSKKTLCVLSREFLNDGWCLEAFSLAQTKMLEEIQDVLLVLLVDNIPHYRLMKYELVRTYFQTRRYLCWPEDSQDLEWFYNHLKHSILKDTKVKPMKRDTETNHEVTNCEAVTAF
ncbi:toll-like receptor 5 [Clarias magur]|uniref:Toll-like receptor 5 n=1 Tax=Clarias magur TaxID=1594786 RepID=A0A8J4TYL8_CLAMG|nr:toll-like receptor 5 [Clarias magur]